MILRRHLVYGVVMSALCVSCRTTAPITASTADAEQVARFVAETFPSSPDILVSARRVDLQAPGSAELLVTLECVGHAPCDALPVQEGAPHGMTMGFMLYDMSTPDTPKLLWSRPRLTPARAFVDVIDVDGTWPRELLLHALTQSNHVLWTTQVIAIHGEVSHPLEHAQLSVVDLFDIDGDGRDELIVRALPHPSSLFMGYEFSSSEYVQTRRPRVYVDAGSQWEEVEVVLNARQVKRLPDEVAVRLYRAAPGQVSALDVTQLMKLYESLGARHPLSLYADGDALFTRGPRHHDLDLEVYHPHVFAARTLHERWSVALDMLDVLHALADSGPSEEVAAWALARVDVARTPEEIAALYRVHHAAMSPEARRTFHVERTPQQLDVVYGELSRDNVQLEDFARVHPEQPSLTPMNRAWFSAQAMRELGRLTPEQYSRWFAPITALAAKDDRVLDALLGHEHLVAFVVRELITSTSWDDTAVERIGPRIAYVVPDVLSSDYSYYSRREVELQRLIAVIAHELEHPQSLENLSVIARSPTLLIRHGITLTQIMRAGLAWLEQAREGANHKLLDPFKSLLCGHVHELPRDVTGGMLRQLARHGALGTFCGFQPMRSMPDKAERALWSGRMLELMEGFDAPAAVAILEGPIDSSPLLDELSPSQKVRFEALKERERERARTRLPSIFERASGPLRRHRELFAALALIRQDPMLDDLLARALEQDDYWTGKVCGTVYGALLNPFRQTQAANLTDSTVARFSERCAASLPWKIEWPQ